MGGDEILIVGAGLGGLTAALALHRAGFEVRVFERAAELAEVGAGITLWSNALRVLDHVGVGEAVRAVGARTGTGVLATARGRTLTALDSEAVLAPLTPPELYAFHRADLQRALYEQLPSGLVTMGATFARYEDEGDRVVAHFEGGEVARGAVLVGADGIHSAVRRQLLGDEAPRYAGYTCWRGIARREGGFATPHGEIVGRGVRLGSVGIGDARTYWYAAANAPAGIESPAERRKADVLARFGHFELGVPELIEATPDEAILHNDIIDRPPVQGWSQGRVTLLGDAVHPTTPNLGQGAAMAMESAVVLARALDAHPDPVTALQVYERTRYGRARLVNQRSWRIGRLMQVQNGVLAGLRNALLAYLPKPMQAAQLRQVAGYDASAVPLIG